MPPLPYLTFPSLPDRHPFNMAPPNYHPDGEYSQWYAPPHSPTAADSPPQAVTITLRSTRPTTFQTRNIILRPDEPVNVGRSSRSETKNLSATPDNALFDCPVISRRHAELELKVNKWTEEKHTVFIKDTGSMHGTSVNGQKLVPTRPFQLKEGDTIRLGESVNRADSESIHDRIFSSSQANTIKDNYDGVTVTLHCISTATKKTTAPVKNTQQGISVPSDSESEFDDDDEDSDGAADLHPLSVHTTLDQGNVKPGLQPSAQVGSSRSNVITVEDDDDDEPVPLYTRRVQCQTGFNTYMVDDVDSLITRHVPVQPAFVPDTYADDSVMVADPHAAPAPHSSLQFDESYAALEESEDVKAAMAVAETAPNADEGSDHEDVNSEEGDEARSNAWSDEDHFSDEGQDSDEHSVSYEDFDRQSFLSEEFNMSDDAAVEDDEDDEGPEVMSSKRRLSNELGSLGDEPDHALFKSTHLYPIAPRPHYDPVRGCEVSGPSVDRISTYRSYGTLSGNPSDDMFADPGHSNKWDVGPATTSEEPGVHNYSFFGQSYPQRMPMMSHVMPNSFDLTPVNDLHETFSSFANNGFQVASPLPVASDAVFANDTIRSPEFPPAEECGIFNENNNKKRKAAEISTSDVPITTAQAPGSSEVMETANVADASTNTVATAIAPAEPQPKKRKIKQPHSQKSMLRTAVIEAGKYTAGAIIGGIGLVTILASPIGEALASC
jgi:pSer/pThr/pTyr-binding forkhead associated (FHA) protein